MDKFTGMVDSKRIGEFISAALTMDSLGEDENLISGLIIEADKAVAAGDLVTAERLVNEVLSHEKWIEKYGGRMMLLLAYINVKNNQFNEAYH